MTSERKIEKGSVETWESARGGLAITQPAAGAMLFTYHGYMTAEVVPFVKRSVDRVLAARIRPDLFIDLERMAGYDSEYRQAISRWGSQNYRNFGQVHFLVRSKIVAMGVAVSNLTAGGILKPTTKRPDFERALADSIARHSTPPKPDGR